MLGEVIRGGFEDRDEASDAGPSCLPASAEIGLPVLDHARAAILSRLDAAHRALMTGDEDWAWLQLKFPRGDLDLKSHFQPMGSTRAAQRRGA